MKLYDKLQWIDENIERIDRRISHKVDQLETKDNLLLEKIAELQDRIRVLENR